MALAQNRDKPVGWSVKFINLFDKFLLLIQTFGRISFRMYSRHSTRPGVPYRSGLVWGYSSRCGPDKGTRVKLANLHLYWELRMWHRSIHCFIPYFFLWWLEAVHDKAPCCLRRWDVAVYRQYHLQANGLRPGHPGPGPGVRQLCVPVLDLQDFR